MVLGVSVIAVVVSVVVVGIVVDGFSDFNLHDTFVEIRTPHRVSLYVSFVSRKHLSMVPQ